MADQVLPPGIGHLERHLTGKGSVERPTIFPLSQLFDLLSNFPLIICISQIKLKLNLPDHSSGAMMKKEKLAELLLDHHKDTFQIILYHWKVRNRLFLFILILLALMAYYQLSLWGRVKQSSQRDEMPIAHRFIFGKLKL